MTTEKTFFLRILSDHILRKPSESMPGLNWPSLFTYARSHQVGGIVYYQCWKFMPSEVKQLFERPFIATLYLYKQRETIIKDIKSALTSANVPALTVKGMEVAQYYPVPALRTMGDVDIVVHKSDKTYAGMVLESLGFHIIERNPDYDWPCTINGLLFELHHNLIYCETITQKKHEEFFNNYWNFVKNGRLDPSFHLLYLLAHLRKHLMNRGVGFRMFMDLAVMTARAESLDWAWIEHELVSLDMLKFGQVCFGLIDSWFAIRAPILYPPLDKCFVETVTEKIFVNGIFGYDNSENDDNSAVNHIKEKGGANYLARCRFLIRSIYPSYNSMANSPYYHFVRGRPWLLPVAWLYRVFRLMRGKTKSVHEILKRINTSKDTIDAREEELRMWGLSR